MGITLIGITPARRRASERALGLLYAGLPPDEESPHGCSKPLTKNPSMLFAISEHLNMKREFASIENQLSDLLTKSWSIMRELQRSNVPVVQKSVPVLYFGNLQDYLSSPLRVITAALNPSANEFPSNHWDMRFPGATETSENGHYAALNQYFDSGHHPLWEWFVHFDALLEGMGCGFLTGRSSRALHTDLCSPIATQPTYSGLTRQQQSDLEQLGMPLWSELAQLIDPDVIVMSGSIAMRDRVSAFVDTEWLRVFGTGRKSVDIAEINVWGRRRLGVFGLTTNVPFGALSFAERRAVGALIAEALRPRNTPRIRATKIEPSIAPESPKSRPVKAHITRRTPGKRRRGGVVEAASKTLIENTLAGLPAASYNFSRLCFRRDVIESIGPNETFRVITPIGTFQMTKTQFRRDFPNVVASKSYREGGIYHYPKPPLRAERYRL